EEHRVASLNPAGQRVSQAFRPIFGRDEGGLDARPLESACGFRADRRDKPTGEAPRVQTRVTKPLLERGDPVRAREDNPLEAIQDTNCLVEWRPILRWSDLDGGERNRLGPVRL